MQALIGKDTSAFEKLGCPQCGDAQMMKTSENGRAFCMSCGFVPTEEIGHNANPNPELAGRALTTGSTFEDSSENGTDTTTSSFSKWKKFVRVSNQTEKNFATALWKITRTGVGLSLTEKHLETASSICKVVFAKRLTKGRSIRDFCAAIVYATCKQCGIVRSLDEIARAFKTSRRKISHCYRILLRELDCSITTPSLDQYVSMLLNHFQLREDVGRLADRISKATEDSRISSGKNPMGAASAIIYLACKLSGERLTQREISNAAGATEVTIRKRYKELQRNLAFIVTL